MVIFSVNHDRIQLVYAVLAVPILCSAALGRIHRDSLIQETHASADDEKAIIDFTFTNTGEHPVTIRSVTTTCGCTTAQLTKETYGTGEKRKITATFTFGQREGVQTKRIVVRTDDAEASVSILTMRVHVPELLKIRPRMLNWRREEKDDAKTIRVEVLHERPIYVLGVRTNPKRPGNKRLGGSKKSPLPIGGKGISLGPREQADEPTVPRPAEPAPRFETVLKTIKKGRQYLITVRPTEHVRGGLHKLWIDTDFPTKQKPRPIYVYLRYDATNPKTRSALDQPGTSKPSQAPAPADH